MTACGKCGISCMARPLQRTNPLGDKGIFWCEPCIKKHEPELYANIQEDKTEAEKDIIDALYNKGGEITN